MDTSHALSHLNFQETRPILLVSVSSKTDSNYDSANEMHMRNFSLCKT